MIVTPVRGVKRKAGSSQYLNSGFFEELTEPRPSDGRTSRRTAQNHVSVTVQFDPCNDLRVNREELAYPGTWIESGEQNRKGIESVRRGDIALAVVGHMPFVADSGYTNNTLVFTHLNRLSRAVKIQVVGTVENPSQHNGTGLDNFGNVQCYGTNSIVNKGPYFLTHGDEIFALPRPETVLMDGVRYSGNAVKGAGDGSSQNEDWSQKLEPMLIPLKETDIKLTLENLHYEIDAIIAKLWKIQTEDRSVSSRWTNTMIELSANLQPDVIMLIPGMKEYAMLYFFKTCMEMLLFDFFQNIDKVQTVSLIKLVYNKSQQALKAYWREQEQDFASLNNPDDLRRLAKCTGDWLVPVGMYYIRESIKKEITAEVDLVDLDQNAARVFNTISDQVKNTSKSIGRIKQLISTIQYTMGWIEANDIALFLERMYVGRCLSAQASPGAQFDILRN